ncbi:MAG: EAL domain-containing protein, partial [Burkholderiaceae bacterium]|nr:EAL domain-containing protein [Burkholderiaceae bacterium]
MADALPPEVTSAQATSFAAAMQIDSHQSGVGAEILLPAACIDLAQWFHYLERLRLHHAASFVSGHTPFRLAIDVPQRLIMQDMALIQSFTQMLQAYVVNHALAAQTICLEMDESFLQSSPMVLDHFYRAMSEAEIMLCLDHYGRPQSRFGSQCEPFFSLVKLSVHLCDRICDDARARSQIEGIVTLAKTMGQIPIAQNSTHDATSQSRSQTRSSFDFSAASRSRGPATESIQIHSLLFGSWTRQATCVRAPGENPRATNWGRRPTCMAMQATMRACSSQSTAVV